VNAEKGSALAQKVTTERRDFLKKLAVAAAFAAPTVATFSLDGVRKKAFAQSVYTQPRVILLEQRDGEDGIARVVFSQPMNTTVGGDGARTANVCRTTNFVPEGYFPHQWAWEGNTMQVLTFSGFCDYRVLEVTYNQGNCGAKFVGANGMELEPYSGSLSVTVCA